MLDSTPTLTFSVPLAWSAHSVAEQFSHQQAHLGKAKQVYLNTLAVYAVNFYMQCLGFETELEKSDSWNPVMQQLTNVADLAVKNVGRLECLPVLPNRGVVYIPAEVGEDTIAYVAVQIDESLREATLLGFTEGVNRGRQECSSPLPLTQLQSLEDFPLYLHQMREPEPVNIPIDLSRWLKKGYEAGWQAVETLLDPEGSELDFRFRSTTQVTRCKEIALGQSGQSVVMRVAIAPESDGKMEIEVEVHPAGDRTYLPPNLQVMLLDEEGQPVMDVQARSENKNIQLEFSGETGDGFSIKVVFEEISVTEDFVI